MAKTIVQTNIGGDGAVADLKLEGGFLIAEVKYPVVALMKPVTDAIDSGFTKLEDVIPGDWDKAILDPIKAGIIAEVLSLLSE